MITEAPPDRPAGPTTRRKEGTPVSDDNKPVEGTEGSVARPVTAAQLMAEAQRAASIAEELRSQALAAAAAEAEATRPKQPPVGEDGPAFVTFTRYMSGREYHYAAVGWRVGPRSVRWMITGSQATRDRLNWAGLLQTVGEANWSTLRVLTPGDFLLPEGVEPPVAEQMGSFGMVASSRRLGGYAPGGYVE
ncbi:hypothetical protein SEA_ZENTENO07_105 [Mycobacterium phage Zenteno07]|nr:hypothetical protein SEA_ZENTENO07_105 [Mycobacterium phage Zenteno07]